ncbi:MAG: hydroxymethylbilane synthase [Planctomycetota bacterium]
MKLRLGTRGSALARAQSNGIVDMLREQGHDVELVVIRSEGDVDRRSLAEIGGQGAFTAALSRALLDDRIDFAVHSLKDLPTRQMEGLTLGAVPRRADPRDALITRWGTGSLIQGSTIGTGSLRRSVQLSGSRTHKIADLRGNVDTRLARLLKGDFDGVVLAMAGLQRLGLSPSQEAGWQWAPLKIEDMTPAVGQGALGLECRSDRHDVISALATVEDAATREAILIERQLLGRLGGGCQVPFAAHVTEGVCHLMLADPVEGRVVCRMQGPATGAGDLFTRMQALHGPLISRLI